MTTHQKERSDQAESQLDATFAALANSTRRAILNRLATGEATVNELAEPFAMTLPAISRHIKVLERAGLISQGQRAQFRPCKIEPTQLQEVASWADDYRPVWESRLDRLDNYVQAIQSQSTAADSPTSPKISTKPTQTDGDNQ